MIRLTFSNYIRSLNERILPVTKIIEMSSTLTTKNEIIAKEKILLAILRHDLMSIYSYVIIICELSALGY